ncbi:uncharacterized protein LOC135714453 [Ochlerotatus camptorhynchus]|uniref:uncharacterized protein LOC135714453 n=1 Tax=Ochlerotatus camptorhynchus TaxID=644619 RepID=UPI0031D06CFB
MRTKFVQPLDDYQLALNGQKTRYEFEKVKPLADEDEFIDVTGDDSSDLQVKIIPILEQPPSKIYYDNIEKESSDGGFFDRDDLDDEDEKNDLIIDFKFNGETGEKKTESGIYCKADKEPELVFNFTLVDTQLVYNEPSIVPKLPNQKDLQSGASDRPMVSITIPPPSMPSPPRQKHSILANKLKEARIYPYPRTNSNLSNGLRRASVPIPVNNGGFYRTLLSNEPIGSRFRPSAFSPPVKSHVVPQCVPLKSSMRRLVNPRSQFAQPPPGKPTKKLYRQSALVPQQQLPYPPYERYVKQFRAYGKDQLPILPEAHKSPSYLPPQFGFGSSVLQNLYDPDQPLDLTKNSYLSQYESMLKYPHQHQLWQGHSILRSMPVPKPPQPPKTALRPQLVPFKQHPTLSQIQRFPLRPTESFHLRQRTLTPPEPTTTSVIVPSESFRQNMNHEIEEFFTHRQNELCEALRLFNVKCIELEELFRRLNYFKIQFSRDYFRVARTMMKRYGYRFRTGAPPTSLDYRWQEPPQDFVDYFRKVKKTLRPHAPEETLNIYRMVIGGLLEQFRGPLEHFLSRNLLYGSETGKTKVM